MSHLKLVNTYGALTLNYLKVNHIDRLVDERVD